MKSKIIVLFIFFILILTGGFYFRSDLMDLYSKYSQKFAEAEKISIDSLLNRINKQVSLPPPLRSAKEAPQASLTKAGVIKWTNAQRGDNNLPVLTENKELNFAALIKAQDMFKKQYFAHESPSGEGPSDLAKKVNYEFLAIGENLALGNFEDDKDLVQAWMDSPGHRANILNVKYQEIGVAVIKGTFEGKITWLAVQELGLPMSACPQIDQNLKTKIETSKRQINDLTISLETQKTALQNIRRQGAADSYNQKISEYNQLVNQYNNLVTQTKALVDEYNSQVRQLNACAQ